MSSDLLRLVDAIHRSKNIDREVILKSVETGLQAAAKKAFSPDHLPDIYIDRETGEIRAKNQEHFVVPTELGRVAAQIAKQVITQEIKEAETNVILKDFKDKKNQLISGTIKRLEGSQVIVDLGKIEGVLNKQEQVPGESYRAGQRLRAQMVGVSWKGATAMITLTRRSVDFIRLLFEVEIPELKEGLVEIKELVREPGYRVKIAVDSTNPKIDPVGVCVGSRGIRIKNILLELSSEKVDIIKWETEPAKYIKNALKPAVIYKVEVDEAQHRAKVIVQPDQLATCIGKGGQNIRLASRLSRWILDVFSTEGKKWRDKAEEGDEPPAAEEKEGPQQVIVGSPGESLPSP